MTDMQVHIIAKKTMQKFVETSLADRDHASVRIDKTERGWKLAREGEPQSAKEFAATGGMDAWWVADAMRQTANRLGLYTSVERNGDDMLVEIYR